MPADRKRSVVPHEVFLSHAHQDAAYVKKLAADLRRHNVRIWYSERHVKGAQEWMDEIGKALDRCDWFIVVLTPAAVKSIWVKREVTFALSQARYHGRVIPLRRKTCIPKDLAWPLATIQTISAQPYADGVRRLLALWGLRYREK